MAKSYVKGNQVLIGQEIGPATIEIIDGKISRMWTSTGVETTGILDSTQILIDAGDNILMPGLVDSHVHVNEPGRTEWEGFWTATRAAAAGGITTLIDMPLNSIPPTTTVENFQIKMDSALGKCHVDVGFWGGVVPNNQNELKALVEKGVVGFKCFLINSGVDEFPCVEQSDVDKALKELEGTGSLLAFHAEMDCSADADDPSSQDPGSYDTFLNSRPPMMEYQAIEMIAHLCKKYKNVRCHIVHLSASEALSIISKLKSAGYPLTVETCPHYLTLSAEEIPNRSTQYKCCPPIRNYQNQVALWHGIQAGLIDCIVSDHSPCVAELKCPGEKDFMEAWGGISSVQFGLPVIWTKAQEIEISIADISRLMSYNTAKLVGLGDRKGLIKEGYDADFVVWNPEEVVTIEDSIIEFKHKITPYKGKSLLGKVLTTILRGEIIYNNGQLASPPKGRLVFPVGKGSTSSRQAAALAVAVDDTLFSGHSPK